VTEPLKVLVDMSLLLASDIEQLTQVAETVDAKFQGHGHLIATAMSADPAFDNNCTEGHLVRAMLSEAVSQSGVPAISLSNLGREVVLSSASGVERGFRVRLAERDASGALKVMASSDSILSRCGSNQLSLLPDVVPDTFEQWILAFVVDRSDPPEIREVVAARPIDFTSRTRPGRLILADHTDIPFRPTDPGEFRGDDDDLDLGDEVDGSEETG
jgi:hypothetical protein